MLILLIKCFIMIIWYQNGVKIMIYIDTDSLVPLIKTDDFYEVIKDNVEERWDKSSYY